MNPRAAIVFSLAAVTLVPMACSSTEESAPTSVRPVNPQSDGGGTDGAPASCNVSGDCVKGEPQKLADFLNACSDGECAPFDNVARLPLYKACEPLPPIP